MSNTVGIEKKYSREVLESIHQMRMQGDSVKVIYQSLMAMFPKGEFSLYAVRKICLGVDNSRDVLSVMGKGRNFFRIKVCDEVRDFLRNLPKGVNRNALVNNILLMYVRQLDLSHERIGENREKRLAELRELNERFADTHYIPIEESKSNAQDK